MRHRRLDHAAQTREVGEEVQGTRLGGRPRSP